MEKHNGWTNYATWRINLEQVDGMSLADVMGWIDADDIYMPDVSQVSAAVRDMVESALFEGDTETPIQSYARAFMADVNWDEIARRLLDDAA